MARLLELDLVMACGHSDDMTFAAGGVSSVTGGTRFVVGGRTSVDAGTSSHSALGWPIATADARSYEVLEKIWTEKSGKTVHWCDDLEAIVPDPNAFYEPSG